MEVGILKNEICVWGGFFKEILLWGFFIFYGVYFHRVLFSFEYVTSHPGSGGRE